MPDPNGIMGFLRKISPEELETQRDILRKQLPQSIVAHGLVDMTCRFDLKNYEVEVFVATDSSIKSMVVVMPASSWTGVQSLAIYYKEEEKDEQEFARLMMSVPGLDWSKPLMVYASPNYITTELSSAVESGLIKTNLTEHILLRGATYMLHEADLSSTVGTPDCGYIGSLKEDHASLVHTNWGSNFLVQEEDIRKMISNAPSAAIYVDENGESKPVSWIRMHRHGELGNTYTLPEYRRRGLASVVTLALAKKAVAAGCVPYCHIRESNVASLEFHRKLGYKRVLEFCIPVFIPPGMTLDSLDGLTSKYFS